MRQISELEDEDFSLLECAVEEASGKAPLRPNSASRPRELQGSLHIGLGAEDLENSSIAEQLESLLERLRLDSKRRVSSDSGAVSDLESCSVTALGEDLRQDREKCSLLFDTPHGEVSGGVEPSADIRSAGRNEVTDSSACGPTPNGGGRGKPIAGKNSDTLKATYSISRQRAQHAFTKRGRKNTTPHRDLEASSTHQNVVEKNAPLTKEVVRPRIVEQTAQTEVAQNHNRQQDNSELEPGEKTHLSTDQELVADTYEPNAEDSSSPTEGGPFITHWGKGRLKRSANNHNSRDYHSNRRPYNSQYTQYNRQRFGGVKQQRYPVRGHSGYTTFHGRDVTQSSHRNEVQQRGKGWETGGHYKTGKARDQFEREKSPQQRREQQQPVVSVSKKISSAPVTVAPAVQSTVSSAPSQVAPENPSQQKLSYASVTGSVGKNMAGAVAKPPLPPCNGVREQRHNPSSGQTDSATNGQISTSSCDTKEQRATVSDVVKEERDVASCGIKKQQTTATDDDDVQSFYQDIAASFNYNEVVEFLRKGEFTVST